MQLRSDKKFETRIKEYDLQCGIGGWIETKDPGFRGHVRAGDETSPPKGNVPWRDVV